MAYGRYSEHLLYVCSQCGYAEKRPTQDAKHDEEAARKVPNINVRFTPDGHSFCPGHLRLC
jgi:hypothetical protein